MTPEETKKAAHDAAVTGAEDKLGGMLAQYSELLPGFYPVNMPPPANEEEYRRMARELIDNRKFNAPGINGGVVEISIDDLEAKDAANGGKIQAALKGRLRDKVPTREQVNTIADNVGDSVAEETGSIGFLGGATIMGALMGFIQWLINGFTNGFDNSPGLKETIAGVTAANMGNSVGNGLAKLRSERPDMAGMLGDETIIDTVRTTYYTTLDKAGFADPNAPKATSIKDVKLATLDDATIHADIVDAVMRPNTGDPKKDVPLAKQIADQLIEGKNKLHFWEKPFAPGDDDLKRTGQNMASIIAGTIADSATDAEFAKTLVGKSRNEVAAAYANEVGDVLSATNKKVLGLPMDLNDKNANGVTYLDDIKAKVAKGIEEHYDLLAGASRIAVVNSENAAREQSLAAIDQKAKGMTTGGETHEGPNGRPLANLTQQNSTERGAG